MLSYSQTEAFGFPTLDYNPYINWEPGMCIGIEET